MGVSVSAKHFKDIVMCTPWGGARILPYGCTILPWLLFLCFCIPSLPWLATAWLNLLIGTQGLLWRLDEAYNQEMGDRKTFMPGVSWDPSQYHYWILFEVFIPFWLKSWFCREEGEWFFLYPFEFWAETSCCKNTDEQQKNRNLLTCMPPVYMGNKQDNLVTPWDGPSH